MTVIAWDGRTLAADKRATNSGLQRTVTKVFKVLRPATEKRGAHFLLVAGSGGYDLLIEMVKWITEGEDPATFPAAQRTKEDYCPMVVIDQNELYVYEMQPSRFHFEDRHYACGSGRDFALMAMRLGKSATEAVELTSEFQVDCGNGVDSVSLE
jgi:hypothetical protein